MTVIVFTPEFKSVPIQPYWEAEILTDVGVVTAMVGRSRKLARSCPTGTDTGDDVTGSKVGLALVSVKSNSALLSVESAGRLRRIMAVLPFPPPGIS